MTERPPLWTTREIADAVGAPTSADASVSGVAIDSRSLRPGDLFVAIRGLRVDGHAFVADAFARGAAAALVAVPPSEPPAGAPLIVVDDTLAALNRLAQYARRRTAARIVGVTGSVGKTGVKEALRTVLSAQGATTANDGSLNNHWGLPLSLARLPRDDVFGVFEMGMNHPGEIDALTRLACPDVAVITAIAPAHMEFFPSLDAVADAKAEIFAGLTEGGAAVLPRDSPQFERLARAAAAAGVRRLVGFGRAAAADVRWIESISSESGSRVRADVAGTPVAYRIELPGTHWINNSLCVLAAVAAVGADVSRAAAALSQVRSPNRRGERFRVPLPGGDVVVIDDSYNANPTSMAAAIEVLGRSRPGPGGRRVAVLGDMLELGAAAPAMHAGLAAPLDEWRIDVVFTAGPQMAALADALPDARRGGSAGSAADVTPVLLAALRPGDVVLVKGSAGSRMGTVVAALRERSAPTGARGVDRD